MVYLCIELAQLEHEVYLLSHTNEPGTYRRVHNYDYTQNSTRDFYFRHAFDSVVVINASGMGADFRSVLPHTTRLMLWATVDIDQPPLLALLNSKSRTQWDYVIAVCEYQLTRLVNFLHLEASKCLVLRNAISPAFENLFASETQLSESKRAPATPLMVYTSTPFRGLEQLLEIFPRFRKMFPPARLRVYSSMKVYQKSEGQEEQWLVDLYGRCQSTPGIEYIGSLAQPHLAEELRSASILAYPNVFAETSCIAAMEAMASGCLVVTSEFGALPETVNRFSQLVPVAFRSLDDFLQEYYDALAAVFMEFYSHPEGMYKHLWEQVQFTNRAYTWRARALEWMETLHNLGITG